MEEIENLRKEHNEHVGQQIEQVTTILSNEMTGAGGSISGGLNQLQLKL